MLSFFILRGALGGSTEKYDERLGLKAISQTIEPLLNSYQAVHDKLLAKSILAEAMGGMGDLGLGGDDPEDQDDVWSSPWEMAVHRYVILLLMSFSPEGLQTHLAKLSREILAHPLVKYATQVYAAFQTDDYGKFLRCYRQTDFLTAVAMSGVADLARLRALWLLVRTYPQPVGDRIPFARIKSFLAFGNDIHCRSFLHFHGVQVRDENGGSWVVLPKKGTPEANSHPLLTGPAKLPEECKFPKGADSALEAKLAALGLSRADVVMGSADPTCSLPAAADEVQIIDADTPEKAAAAAGKTQSPEPPLSPAPRELLAVE